ncbi:MAG: CBS domain-containing protein [Flavobacteriales bacterium]|nr:CBS domain-containing protein [Flavobacteriales bacterium]MCZ2442613.1 CBS domain-containing protein [Flavobacteriales bacterium]
MIAEDLISNEIPPLKTSDSGLKALTWMEEFRVSHLPIVNHQDLLGVISEEDIFNLNSPEDALGNHRLSLYRPYVKSHQHLYEVIKIATELNLSIVPVIDTNEKYLGLVTMPDLVKALATLASVKDTGAIIVLELNERDYNLSQIANIVESNDCRILSVYLRSVPDSTKLDVVLKLNRTDLRGVLATFNRYNYTVKASYMETGYDEDMRERFDLLMNYLNM